jgi:hypothetical protein
MLGSTAAYAQQTPSPQTPATPGDTGGDGVVYKKVTEMDFDADDVEGSFVRPEGEYLDARRRARYSSLIRVRKDFIPEMLKSAEDI